MSVQELEAAVAQLPKEELARFTQWFEEYVADAWDRQIEADALGGRFDAAGKRAKADYEAGLCTPLPAVTSAAESGSRYPLRGTAVTLLSPTEPVAEANWEAAG